MGKKDFSANTSSVFNSFFSQPAINEDVKPTEQKAEETISKKNKEPKKIVKETGENSTIKNVELTNKLKSREKKCRCNFFLDIELEEFVNNFLWLRRESKYAVYINKLIRNDFLDLLGLPINSSKEEIIEKWELYKKENNL